MTDRSVDDTATAILLRAASIVRGGWSQRASARTASGSAIVSTAPLPPNALPPEIALAPVAFDVGSAIFRAAARQMLPHGVKKEDAKLLYWAVPPSRKAAWNRAQQRFCLTAGAIHISDWNDRVCSSAEEAAEMLERAAAAEPAEID